MIPRLKALVPAIFLMSALVYSCLSSGQEMENPKFAGVDAEKAREMITANAGNDHFILLDTRTRAEYDKSHLDHAVFINYNADDYWEQIDKMDKKKVYLVYCHSGGRSGKTVDYMMEHGFTEAHNLEGGIIAWKRAGYDVVRD